jgi:oligopeptide/dipeptide ABC transporter ATP-binding protein
MTPIVELRNVTKVFGRKDNINIALDDVTFAVEENYPHIITVAGESGSGKTTMMMLLLGFYEPSAGSVLFQGQNIWDLDKAENIRFRRHVQAVFQDPFAVYNPFYKVDNLLSIPINNFKIAKNKAETYELMENALRRVGLRPEETLGRYPHQLSGGQRQRIAVARALIIQPKILIADEPVSMVDASMRAVILKQIRELNQESSIPVLYITHDLTTAYHVSDYIMVLYRGSVMEAGDVEKVIRDPQHPYTRLLVNSIPWPDPKIKWGKAAEETNRKITHNVGCRFAPRCPSAFDRCTKAPAPLFRVGEGQVAACYLFEGKEQMDRKELTSLFPRK